VSAAGTVSSGWKLYANCKQIRELWNVFGAFGNAWTVWTVIKPVTYRFQGAYKTPIPSLAINPSLGDGNWAEWRVYPVRLRREGFEVARAGRPSRAGLECRAGKSLFMKVISARSPATLGMWPAKEFKLANFWDAK
jgi:hypothetical protein